MDTPEAVDWLADLAALNTASSAFSVASGYGPSSVPPPNAPASDAAIEAAERHLGEPLGPQYRGLLAAVDGWTEGFDDADLFGTDDLLGRTGRVAEWIKNLEAFNERATFRVPWPEDIQPGAPSVPPLETIRNDDLLPIASASYTLDLILVGRPGRACAGQVVHIQGSAVSRYASLAAFVRQRTADLWKWTAERTARPSNDGTR